TCPANIALQTQPGVCTATTSIATPAATDNCSTPTVLGVRSDGKPFSEPYPVCNTTITWTATDASGNSSLGCIQTITVTATPPVAPALSSNSPIYVGDTLQLTASSIPGATYSWTGPNGFTSNLQNPTIPNATGAASGIYTVTASVGCSSVKADISVLVKVKPRIGDTVWMDSDGDGTYEPAAGEIGIPGVLVSRTGGAATSTSGSGWYRFEVVSGTYTVTVASANFGSGAPLRGLHSTTGGENLTRTVADADDMTYDFGYQPVSAAGVGTPGYWKNHPEAWPVQTITIGGVTYAKAQAISLITEKPSQDRTYNMFSQLVSAMLNVAIGNNSSCIESTILAANAWMVANPLGSNVPGGGANSPWRSGEPLHSLLDQYNNGKLCAPARD
ncbi:MAG: HYR domain-containing protein, partial [Acidobacteria bacterium]|nr:HYR domain-containing protein [Acidobacteriota bacterium]